MKTDLVGPQKTDNDWEEMKTKKVRICLSAAQYCSTLLFGLKLYAPSNFQVSTEEEILHLQNIENPQQKLE